VKRSGGTSGAWFIAISALVLAGFPTTSTFTLSAARSLIASPCGRRCRRWPRADRSAPFPSSATRAHEQPQAHAVEGVLGVVGEVHVVQEREGAVVQLHRHASSALIASGISSIAQLHRRLGAEHLTGGYPDSRL